jgi:hypothetical protein
MGLSVETSYLRGYADQLEANKLGALEDLTKYVNEHCKNFDRIEGSLYPARWPLEFAANQMRDALADATLGMSSCAKELRYTADVYDKSDEQSAERLWEAARTHWGDIGEYREKDVSTAAGFSHGANVDLAAPKDREEVSNAKDAVYSALGMINGWVERLTGIDILAKVLPLVFGDWGALRRIADAWSELEQGFQAVAKDLNSGMDVLSEHWDSSQDGASGASMLFDYHIRERWVPAYEALGQVCSTVQQGVEQMAQFYETVVHQVLFVLNFYAKRIKNALLGIRNALKFTQYLSQLLLLVTSLIQLVVDAIELVWLQIKTLWEGFQTVFEGIVSLRNYLRGDFDALATG